MSDLRFQCPMCGRPIRPGLWAGVWHMLHRWHWPHLVFSSLNRPDDRRAVLVGAALGALTLLAVLVGIWLFAG